MKLRCIAISYSCQIFTESKVYEIENDSGRLLITGDHDDWQLVESVIKIGEGLFFVPSCGAVFVSTAD